MTFIKNSITKNISILFLLTVFVVGVSTMMATDIVHASDGWEIGGDTCVSCADTAWSDWNSSSDDWSDWNTSLDDWSDWNASYDTTWSDWNASYDDSWSDWNSSSDDWSDWNSATFYNDEPRTFVNDQPRTIYNDEPRTFVNDQPRTIYDDTVRTYYHTPTKNYTYSIPSVNIVKKKSTPVVYTQPTIPKQKSVVTYTGGTNLNYNNNQVTNTNTNVINNNIPVAQPQPVVNYAYPTTYMPYRNPNVGVAYTGYTQGYDYVDINQIPYTGTQEMLYILSVVAIALGAVAVYFRKEIGTAFARFTGTARYASEEVVETPKTPEASAGESATLTLEKGEGGPRLSFTHN